jgi:hypothetical protein
MGAFFGIKNPMVLGSNIIKIKAAVMNRNILKIFIISVLEREWFKC